MRVPLSQERALQAMLEQFEREAAADRECVPEALHNSCSPPHNCVPSS